MPDIHSPKMESPLKERYQIPTGTGNNFDVRLPCDEMKLADTLKCDNMIAYCTSPNDKIVFALQGAGDMFFVD